MVLVPPKKKVFTPERGTRLWATLTDRGRKLCPTVGQEMGEILAANPKKARGIIQNMKKLGRYYQKQFAEAWIRAGPEERTRLLSILLNQEIGNYEKEIEFERAFLSKLRKPR